jgi:type I restriction enzyme S subunit
MSFSSDDLQQYPLGLADLPLGWVVSDLAALATKIQPGFPSGKHNQEGQGVPHLRPMNVSRDGMIDLTDLKYVQDHDGPRLNDGDVLFNNTNSPALVGKTAVVRRPIDWSFSNHMTRITPAPGVIPSYLAHHLHYLWMTGYFRHRCVNHVNQASISSGPLATTVPIAVPPSAEQHRIVAAIDEKFSRLDAAVAALKQVEKKLRRARAAVLGSVYKAAADSFGTATLSRVIGNTALFVDGNWVETKDQDPGGDHRLTQLADVGDGVWRNRSSRFMNAEQFTRLHCTSLHKEDVLVARMPDPLGRACLFPGDRMPCATVVDVAIIRPTEGHADARWLMWILNSPQVRNQVAALAKGTTRRRITRRNLGTLEIPNADVSAQRNRVLTLEASLVAISRMEEAITVARVRDTALRSSILGSAFGGKLVPQYPSDEPASVLLKRIAMERASSNDLRTRVRKPPTTRAKVPA